MKSDRQYSIDGWRGIFCFFIIFYHFYKQKNGLFYNGYLGVDFFFILSGFMWMKSMEKGRYTNSIDIIYDKAVRFFPAVIYILLIRIGYMLIIGDQSLKTVVINFIHMLYESLALYSIGMSV